MAGCFVFHDVLQSSKLFIWTFPANGGRYIGIDLYLGGKRATFGGRTAGACFAGGAGRGSAGGQSGRDGVRAPVDLSGSAWSPRLGPVYFPGGSGQ